MNFSLTYCVAMSVVLLCVSLITRCDNIQWIYLIIQNQSPAHFLCSRISHQNQTFIWEGDFWLTGYLFCVFLLGKHSPHRQIWTGVYVEFFAKLVHLKMS